MRPLGPLYSRWWPVSCSWSVFLVCGWCSTPPHMPAAAPLDWSRLLLGQKECSRCGIVACRQAECAAAVACAPVGCGSRARLGEVVDTWQRLRAGSRHVVSGLHGTWSSGCRSLLSVCWALVQLRPLPQPWVWCQHGSCGRNALAGGRARLQRQEATLTSIQHVPLPEVRRWDCWAAVRPAASEEGKLHRPTAGACLYTPNAASRASVTRQVCVRRWHRHIHVHLQANCPPRGLVCWCKLSSLSAAYAAYAMCIHVPVLYGFGAMSLVQR